MSGDEKAAQIGNAAAEYQSAKVELAHVETKIAAVFRIYREIGAILGPNRATVIWPTIRETDSGTRLDFGSQVLDFNPAHLLNAADLTNLVAERARAESRLEQARGVLASLGLTAIS